MALSFEARMSARLEPPPQRHSQDSDSPASLFRLGHDPASP